MNFWKWMDTPRFNMLETLGWGVATFAVGFWLESINFYQLLAVCP